MIGRGIGIPFRHVHGTESEISFDKSLLTLGLCQDTAMIILLLR